MYDHDVMFLLFYAPQDSDLGSCAFRKCTPLMVTSQRYGGLFYLYTIDTYIARTYARLHTRTNTRTHARENTHTYTLTAGYLNIFKFFHFLKEIETLH